MLHNKKGFTLLEMMVVIALIGLFFVVTSSMTKDTRSYQTNAERFANSIYDITRGARNNMLIGRGAYSGTNNLVTVVERIVLISNTGITTRYVNVTGSGIESNLPFPFFDKDKEYQIINIASSSGGVINGNIPVWENSGMTHARISIDTASDIKITTTPSVTDIRTLKITTGYRGFEQSVIIDRVTGLIEIRKSNED